MKERFSVGYDIVEGSEGSGGKWREWREVTGVERTYREEKWVSGYTKIYRIHMELTEGAANKGVRTILLPRLHFSNNRHQW